MRLWRHKNGTYYVIIDRNHKRSLSTKNKAEAERILKALKKSDFQKKIAGLEKTETVSEFFADCLEDYKYTKEEATHTSMSYALNAFESYIGPKPLNEVTKKDLSDFVTHRLKMGYAKTSVNIYIRNIKAAFSKAVEWEKLPHNPLSGFKQLKIDKKLPKFLTFDDLDKFTNILSDNSLRHAFFFYVLTGCRRSEALVLTWDDIDFERMVVHIRKTKNHEARDIPICDSLFEVLNGITPKKGYLFPGKIKGTHLDKDAMTHNIKDCLTEAGFPDMRLHDLRHTFASLLALSGETLQTIRDLLGHSDIRTTEIYAHLTADHLKTAVNKLKVNVSTTDKDIDEKQ
jgi:integrase